MSWQDDLKTWGDSREGTPPTASEVDAFLARATAQRTRQRGPHPGRVAVGVGLALAAAAALWVLVGPPTPGPTGWTWTPQAPPVAQVDPPPATLETGTHALDEDQVVVDPKSTVLAVRTGAETRLQLTAGKVHATVAPRGSEGQFSIATEDYDVVVVGTRFSVQREPFEVRVLEGVVEVNRAADQRRWRVVAGEWFAGGVLHRPETPAPEAAPPPPLEDLRALVLDGQIDDARAGVMARLAVDPKDTAARRLLAQLEARDGRTEAAVAAWLALIETGEGPDAQTGRYEAARLLEGEPERVIPLLEAFLRAPHPLAGEARLRLANAHKARGDRAAERAVLEETARMHAGTATGAEAERRLGE